RDATDVDDFERECTLADRLDTTVTVLVAQTEQGIRLTHACPRQWPSEESLDESADVHALIFGLGQNGLYAAHGVARLANGIVVGIGRASTGRQTRVHFDQHGPEVDAHAGTIGA